MSTHNVDSRSLGEGTYGGIASEDMLPHVMRWAEAVDQFTAWMVAAGYTRATIMNRREKVRQLAGANLRRSPWRIKTANLVEWMAAQSWAPETRRNARSAVSSFYAWGIKAGHTKRNPAADLPRIRAPHTVPRPTPDDVAVVAFATASDRDRLILSLAAYAGLRRAEIAGLRWDQIEIAPARPHGAMAGAPHNPDQWQAPATNGSSVNPVQPPSPLGLNVPLKDMRMVAQLRILGKGGRVRVIPIHPVLARELDEERQRRNQGRFGSGYRYTACRCGCVFPGQSGGPMTPNAVGYAATRALGDGWGAHTLRHLFATRTLAATGNLLVVQTLLGHASPNTTIRYTQLADGALADAVNAL